MWVTFEDVQEMHTAALSADADQTRVEGLIRRAERSLVKLLLGPSATPGDLAGFDRDTVVDVVVDAVSRRLHNPCGYVSETAGEYTYRLEKGSDGFWWPQDWQLLFGLSAKAPKRVSTVPVGLTCAWQGWAR